MTLQNKLYEQYLAGDKPLLECISTEDSLTEGERTLSTWQDAEELDQQNSKAKGQAGVKWRAFVKELFKLERVKNWKDLFNATGDAITGHLINKADGLGLWENEQPIKEDTLDEAQTKLHDGEAGATKMKLGFLMQRYGKNITMKDLHKKMREDGLLKEDQTLEFSLVDINEGLRAKTEDEMKNNSGKHANKHAKAVEVLKKYQSRMKDSNKIGFNFAIKLLQESEISITEQTKSYAAWKVYTGAGENEVEKILQTYVLSTLKAVANKAVSFAKSRGIAPDLAGDKDLFPALDAATVTFGDEYSLVVVPTDLASKSAVQKWIDKNAAKLGI